MTRAIESLAEVAALYDAIVLDQWGVLHNGTAPYPGAVAALNSLHSHGTTLAVLSNSGKRSDANAQRIAKIGFSNDLFQRVMTSGEALWADVSSGAASMSKAYPIERSSGDAITWSEGLSLEIVDDIDAADAVLLMGLPDGTHLDDWGDVIRRILSKNLTIYCSNPDLASPREDGQAVVSPGALAGEYMIQGGSVVFYGKPHLPIFNALEAALGTQRLLMVGDSLDHDIAGANAAGWDSVLIQNGLYQADFAKGRPADVLGRLCTQKSVQPPTYTIGSLS